MPDSKSLIQLIKPTHIILASGSPVMPNGDDDVDDSDDDVDDGDVVDVDDVNDADDSDATNASLGKEEKNFFERKIDQKLEVQAKPKFGVFESV